MTLLFAICPGCKTSITLPEGYLNYGSWLSAHQKTCPGERVPKLVARVKSSKSTRGVKARVVKDDPQLETQEFVAEMGARVAVKLINAALGTFFGGKVKG